MFKLPSECRENELLQLMEHLSLSVTCCYSTLIENGQIRYFHRHIVLHEIEQYISSGTFENKKVSFDMISFHDMVSFHGMLINL